MIDCSNELNKEVFRKYHKLTDASKTQVRNDIICSSILLVNTICKKVCVATTRFDLYDDINSHCFVKLPELIDRYNPDHEKKASYQTFLWSQLYPFALDYIKKETKKPLPPDPNLIFDDDNYREYEEAYDSFFDLIAEKMGISKKRARAFLGKFLYEKSNFFDRRLFRLICQTHFPASDQITSQPKKDKSLSTVSHMADTFKRRKFWLLHNK